MNPHFYAIALDNRFPKTSRSLLRRGAALGAVASFGLSLDSMPFYFGKADGFVFLFLFVFLALVFIESFYRSMRRSPGDYALSAILYRTDELDISAALFKTLLGEEVLLKSGLQPAAMEEFLLSERQKALSSSLELPEGRVSLEGYISSLYATDASLKDFLTERHIAREALIDAAKSVSEEVKSKIVKEGWLKMAWLRRDSDNL